jgi:putative hemolysin
MGISGGGLLVLPKGEASEADSGSLRYISGIGFAGSVIIG